jgi:tRNA (cmo5U34)-methyltransferase
VTIEEAFNATVDYYDDWMKKALPNFDELFGVAVDLIPFDSGAHLAVLDLGAGTGLFSQQVLARYPRAGFVLFDLADKMLAVAQERFRSYPQQFRFVTRDYRTLQDVEAFDVAISSLSIHHLEDTAKAALFSAVYRALWPGGAFINVDQVRGETDWLRNLYWENWLARVRQSGVAEERIRESIDRRTTYDRDALLADQLQWLKAAGFENVDCVYKAYFVGVFFGSKAGERGGHR